MIMRDLKEAREAVPDYFLRGSKMNAYSPYVFNTRIPGHVQKLQDKFSQNLNFCNVYIIVFNFFKVIK